MPDFTLIIIKFSMLLQGAETRWFKISLLITEADVVFDTKNASIVFLRFEMGKCGHLRNVSITHIKPIMISSGILAKIWQPGMQQIFFCRICYQSYRPGVFSRLSFWIFTLIEEKLGYLQWFSAIHTSANTLYPPISSSPFSLIFFHPLLPS